MTDLIPTPRPVESPEDRMRHATADDARPGDGINVTQQKLRTLAERAGNPPLTFLEAAALDERDQLDARAAAAEQERDEARDDRDDYARRLKATNAAHIEMSKQLDEAVSMLARIGDAISPTGERPEEALSTLVADVEAMVAERDAMAIAADQNRTELDMVRAIARQQLAKLRAELGRAQELLAIYADLDEQRDRARAAYDTRQGEQSAGLGSPEARAQDEEG